MYSSVGSTLESSFELRHEKTNNVVSEQVRAVQSLKMAGIFLDLEIRGIVLSV